MSVPTEQNPELVTRQLRLALVMNGGVSLAVWMSGVTHELNNCRLAPHVAAPTASSRSVWAEILAKANTTVTIDLIAGASAGGLNGTVLAKAIARNEDLPDVRPLWLEGASLSAHKLLATDPMPAASILNSKYFFDEVRKLLVDAKPDDLPSPAEEPTVSLLVTATALPISDEDDQGADVVQDSRRVYRFAARPGVAASSHGDLDLPEVPMLNDFDTRGKLGTLARAARASAGFPAAFEPVRETGDLREHEMRKSAPQSHWLMDGGVLDNAPFEPLLNELRRRAVSSRFSRAVVYINPSTRRVRPQEAESDTSQPVTDAASAPNIRTTLTALVAAIREPDRRLDVEGVDEALKMMGFTVTDPDHVLAELFRPASNAPITPNGLETAAAALFQQYQLSRRQWLFLAATAPKTLQAAHKPSEDDLKTVHPELQVPSVRGLPPGDDWHWGLSVARHVVRWWGRALAKRTPSDAQRDAFAALGPAQRRLQAWTDAFDQAVAAWTGDLSAWIEAAETHLREHNLPRLVADVLRAAADQVGPVLDSPSGRALLDASLDLEVINRALSLRTDEATDVPNFAFWQITPEAQEPFELGFDNEQSAEWPNRKLYGERWGHFGAFASARGRRWDWLWGRLDAAMTISGRILLDADINDATAKVLQQKLVAAICAEEEIEQNAVVATAHDVLKLGGGDLWTSFRREATNATNTSLRALAAKLPGAVVPRGAPARIHAIADTADEWKLHRPIESSKRRGVLFYRCIGVVAQAIARRKVARLLRPDKPRRTRTGGGVNAKGA
jgi:predicted acylesterase/phospholipase RssA